MTLTLPTHLVDTVSSAAASGVEVAGHLLQEAGHAVSNAADTTSKRARKMTRMARRGGHRRSRGNLVPIVVLGGAAALVVAIGFAMRGRSQRSALDAVADIEGGLPPSSGPDGTAESHDADELKDNLEATAGRVVD